MNKRLRIWLMAGIGRVYASLELRTLNETVATIAGQQLAVEVVKKYPLPADVRLLFEAQAGVCLQITT